MPSSAPTRLWPARLSLSNCVRALIVRDTTGVALGELERLNYFPASPLCTIGWMFSGSSERVEGDWPARPDSPRSPVPGRVMFIGPQSRPSVSWNPGPAHGMMLMLMPDALQLLTGIDSQDWLNRMADAQELLPPDWLAMCAAVQQAGDDEARRRCIEDFLDPRWQAARPAQTSSARRYQDWTQGLALRAAVSAPGRSLRQIERRIKHWAGQPMRELVGISRAEKTFFEMVAAQQDGGHVAWAALAADGGYADQSHLCRVARRITGFAPAELRRRMAEDEAFWVYRIWQ